MIVRGRVFPLEQGVGCGDGIGCGVDFLAVEVGGDLFAMLPGQSLPGFLNHRPYVGEA